MKKYELVDESNEYKLYYPLKAKTDRGARRLAKKLAQDLGISKYSIAYYKTDGTRWGITK